MTAKNDDFQQIEQVVADKRRQQDTDDFNNEMAGRDVGRINRFLSSSHKQTDESEKRKRETTELSRLAILMQNPAYRAAFEQAEQTIDNFKERMNEWLQEYQNQIDNIDEKLEALRPDAAGTPEYEQLTKEREAIQRNQQDLLDYYNTVVQPMEERMADPDNSPSKDEIDEFNGEVQQNMDRFFSTDLSANPTENFSTRPSIDTKLPTLG